MTQAECLFTVQAVKDRFRAQVEEALRRLFDKRADLIDAKLDADIPCAFVARSLLNRLMFPRGS